MLQMRRDPLCAFERCVAEWGDAVSLPFARFRLLLLNHPDHVQRVLVDNARAYRKSASYRELALALGQGLLTSEGAHWKRQRRLCQPSFQRRALARFAPLVSRVTEETIAGWAQQGEVDVHREMVRLTLRVVGHALFSTELGGEADRLGRALDEALPFIVHRTEALFNLPLWVPLPSHLRFRRAVAALDALVLDLVERRQARGPGSEEGGPEEGPGDLLSSLLAARDPETGERMSPRQVRDELVTFLLAGHETTANALSWTLYLLAQHPEVEARLADEARLVLGGRAPTPEDCPRLELTRRVLLEAMRILPPAWVIEREALEDDVVGGHLVPRGTLVMLPTWTVHRHRDHWPEPERFDPDRFAPERERQRPRAAYFPFGLGQRQCIGEGFAMLEMQLVLPAIVQRYRLALAGAPVERKPGVTLRPLAGIAMRVAAR